MRQNSLARSKKTRKTYKPLGGTLLGLSVRGRTHSTIYIQLSIETKILQQKQEDFSKKMVNLPGRILKSQNHDKQI